MLKDHLRCCMWNNLSKHSIFTHQWSFFWFNRRSWCPILSLMLFLYHLFCFWTLVCHLKRAFQTDFFLEFGIFLNFYFCCYMLSFCWFLTSFFIFNVCFHMARSCISNQLCLLSSICNQCCLSLYLLSVINVLYLVSEISVLHNQGCRIGYHLYKSWTIIKNRVTQSTVTKEWMSDNKLWMISEGLGENDWCHVHVGVIILRVELTLWTGSVILHYFNR